MASDTAKKSGGKLDFESTLSQLEALIGTLENNDTSLEESLSAFEKGVKLTRSGQKALASAEQKVQLLLQENGEPVTKDFTEDEPEL